MAGYDQLASLIGQHSDLAIFRRFMTINASNLLCMQAELVNLEAEIKRLSLRDATSDDPEKQKFKYSISSLKGPYDCPDRCLQYDKKLEARQLLREYNEALFQYDRLASLSPANKYPLSVLRDWLSNEDCGNDFLSCHEFWTWHPDHDADLTSLTTHRGDRDALSRWIDGTLLPFYHKILGHRIHDKMMWDEEAGQTTSRIPFTHYSDVWISTTIHTLSTILAPLLPALSIFALFFIHSPLARLGAIVGFTVLFSAIIALIGNGSRIDCFAATAAFAAVQVVFVSVGPV